MFLIVSGFAISILFFVLMFFLNLERTLFTPDFLLRIYHYDETKTERIIDSFSRDLTEKVYELTVSDDFDNDRDIQALELEKSFLKIFTNNWFNLQVQRNINGITGFFKSESNEFQVKISTKELVAPSIIVAKEISRDSGFFDDAIQTLLLQFFEMDKSSKLNHDFGADTARGPFISGGICSNWFTRNYENTIDLIGEYLQGTQNNLHIYWAFSDCADEIFKSVESSMLEETYRTEFYTLLLEDSLHPYLNQEVWGNPINSILESSDIVKVKDLIIESLIQSYGDDFIGLEMQIIFSQMKPYFIEEDDDYLIDIVVLSDEESFGNYLDQNFQNNFPVLNAKLLEAERLDFIELVVKTIPNNLKKSPSELSVILDDIGNSSNIELVSMLRFLSTDGFLLFDESDQDDEFVYLLRFAKDTVTNGYQYDLADAVQNEDFRTQLNSSKEFLNQVSSSKNGIIFSVLLILLLDYFALRFSKISSDQVINFLGFILSIFLFTSLIYILMWNYIILDMILHSEFFLGMHFFAPIGFEDTYQVFYKEMFEVILTAFREFHNQMLIQFVIGLVFLFILVILRVILRPDGLSRIFRKRLH